ncbi:SDR family NAD(P)-dependent oxidoreductase [Kaistia dalseonensis]|uniref:NAD(P)-dependent dehydrogenase (Short-subunit alcohol dehydrogenase family) n=1 Tax=Kaistia dalseonensis TaxID=410840 RepID=A0ABU0H0Q5_9HYPH|nr:SDR family NAD(P)-dependent oxidoreductase [Kaistia dalseonensis]MCX5493329.1 SDR family NAD(P)-dependent oxidoreductase [Kaistia dalseonensis]MDQ0435886.1 NAD(P)-dependent dehydrogenase (short-subunit alcohol dehydrogenase family) [Kaistia dalseonensis]
MTARLDGKKALVTGGGSGIGRATALAFAEAGADVAVLSRSQDEIDAVAHEIRGYGRRAEAISADVSDAASVESAIKRTVASLGGLDIVFANAGINGVWAPLHELEPDEFDQTIAINLRGTFLTLHYAIPFMMQHGGSIIITASINGTRTFTTADASAYSASKAGQVALAKMAALELARYAIRVNVICPGAIETEIDVNTNQRDTDAARVRAIYPDGQVPLTGGKPGMSADVADLALFLASDQSRHITGTPVFIDGGQSLLV